VGIRTKLLLLTLIPLVPLAVLDVVGLFSLERRHADDLEHRLDGAESLWRERVGELTREAVRTADALADSKRIEQALRRNHWAMGRETALGTVVAERDLRALLIDADGRSLADTASERFDLPLGSRPLLARALAGERAQGIERLDGHAFWGAARPVRVVGGIEGVVWVGFSLGREVLSGFARSTQTELVLVDPLGGGVTATLVDIPELPDPPAPIAARTAAGDRRFRLRPVPLDLPGHAQPLSTWVGIDHTALAEAVRTQLLTFGSVLALLLIAILAATVVISQRVAQGLRYVVRKMSLLSEGEYEKIDPVVGRDEIAFLGRGFNDMIDGLIERDFVRETFGRYMSSEVARAVLDHPEGLKLGGEERTVTIMLCDLRGFTAFSSGPSPEEVVRVLNVWLEAMSEVIVEHDGTINEFLGDAILALFGAPVARDDDALRSVACAVSMQKAMAEVNARLDAEDIPPLYMGIGLATGGVVAGNIGSDKRIKYGVVGQPVNMASRVESFTVGDDVLIEEATLAACRGAVETGAPQEVRVKGREEPLSIHPVLGVDAPFFVRLPAADATLDSLHIVRVEATVRVWPIAGKQVADDPILGTLGSLGRWMVDVGLPEELPIWSDVKLQLDTGEAQTSSAVYAKVVAASPAGAEVRTLLRLTRVDARDRGVLDGLRGE